MRINTFQPNFIFSRNEKPKRKIGDNSLEIESINDSQDEQHNYIINEESYEFPQENIPTPFITFNNSIKNSKDSMEPFNISLNDKDRFNNIKTNISNKYDDLNMLKRSNLSKENNRYNNISEIYDDNLKFFSFCEDDFNDDEDDDIVNIVNDETISQKENNKKSTDYVKGFNALYSFKDNNQVQVVLHPDISKIISSGELSDIKSDSSNNNEISQKIISPENSNKISEINNIEITTNISKNEDKKNIINKSNDSNNIIQNNYSQDLRESKKFFDSQKKRAKKILSLTKQKKIFQKFLSVSVDTSYLYSLDDEMDILLLNPKIIYNYPFNKMERELE